MKRYLSGQGRNDTYKEEGETDTAEKEPLSYGERDVDTAVGLGWRTTPEDGIGPGVG